MSKALLTFTLFCCFVFACAPEPSPIIGTWEAIDVRENGDSLALDPAQIGFVFRPNGRYDYRSTLAYREAGTWRHENGYLYAMDTTGQASEQYIVGTKMMGMDSLQLRMKGETGERLVLLLRR